MNKIYRGIVVGGLAAGLLALAPTAGSAAIGEPTVTRSGATVTITAPNVTRADNLTVQEVSGRLHVFGGVLAGTGCTTVSANEVNCGSGVTTLNADLGRGNDRFSSLMSLRGTVNGGLGDDTFQGGRSFDGTAFTYQGGGGVDTVDYGSSGIAVKVSKNGKADDGRPSLDQDNVADDVRVIRGTVGADTLTGSLGDDHLIGGPGADNMRGYAGRDVIDARDPLGTKDPVIDCGLDADTVFVDAADRSDNCETIS